MTAPRPRSRQTKHLDAGMFQFQAEINSFALRLAAEGKASKTILTYTEAVQWFAAARLTGQVSWEQVTSRDIRGGWRGCWDATAPRTPATSTAPCSSSSNG